MISGKMWPNIKQKPLQKTAGKLKNPKPKNLAYKKSGRVKFLPKIAGKIKTPKNIDLQTKFAGYTQNFTHKNFGKGIAGKLWQLEEWENQNWNCRQEQTPARFFFIKTSTDQPPNGLRYWRLVKILL